MASWAGTGIAGRVGSSGSHTLDFLFRLVLLGSWCGKAASQTGNGSFEVHDRAVAACRRAAEAETLRAPDKDEYHYTTSRRFKSDIAARFCLETHKRLTVLEVGIFQGHSTAVLAAIFRKVLSLDIEQNYLKQSALYTQSRDNIVFFSFDTYSDNWRALSVNRIDVVVIDADHKYEKVRADAHNALEYLSPADFLIFDDYGMEMGVRQTVAELLEVQALRDCEPLGLGTDGQPWFLKSWGWVNHSEGVLCKRGVAPHTNAAAAFSDVAFVVYAQPMDPLMRACTVWRFKADGGLWTSAFGHGVWASEQHGGAVEVVAPGLYPGRWEAFFNRPRTAFVLSANGNTTVAFFGIRADKVNQVFAIANEQFNMA